MGLMMPMVLTICNYHIASKKIGQVICCHMVDADMVHCGAPQGSMKKLQLPQNLGCTIASIADHSVEKMRLPSIG